LSTPVPLKVPPGTVSLVKKLVRLIIPSDEQTVWSAISPASASCWSLIVRAIFIVPSLQTESEEFEYSKLNVSESEVGVSIKLANLNASAKAPSLKLAASTSSTPASSTKLSKNERPATGSEIKFLTSVTHNVLLIFVLTGESFTVIVNVVSSKPVVHGVVSSTE